MKIINLRFYQDNQKNIEEIIAGCCKGDASCQEVLFKKYAPLIMTVCRRYEYQGYGASDILQESFVLIFENIAKFDSSLGSIEAWMKRIAINTALNIIRKRKMVFQEIDDHHFHLVDASGDEDFDAQNFSEELLLEKIKELPNGYRTVFNFFVVEGYAHKEIASILGISVQTSKSQLFKAKKMLRKKLNNSIVGGLNRKKENY